MSDLREATTINLKFGPFLDKTDGVTPETGLTPVIKLSKNGGALAARNSGTATAHGADGCYTVELDTVDTNTRGRLKVISSDSTTFVPVWQEFDVLASDVWDEKYSGQFQLQAATSTTATLDTGSSSVNDYFAGSVLVITAGPGAGQSRLIISYVGSTRVATLDRAWATNPTSASYFRIMPAGSALLAAERNAIADALLDRSNAVETGLTFRQMLRLTSAAIFGKVSGATGAAGTVIFRNAIADSKARITCIHDQYGNRTTITVDLT